ncbi:MAG TPA: histidinol-phosphate transaminase [Candidatus Eisenbacteria bacterium]|nr:histidinol-phosphate transaminase [Candidatus Eisenbacteria bacterium]
MPGPFRSNIAALTPYVPGEQPREDGFIKLNTNENPYPPSPRVRAAVKKAADQSLRLYPEPLCDTLRATAAAVYGLRPENILVGNGSDELLSILMRSFVGPGDRVAFPVPTYSLYDTLVAIQEGESVTVEYPDDYALPGGLSSAGAALTFVCNPNSPSGTLVAVTEIERLARAVSGVLAVDEAYIDFAETEAASALPLVRRLPNLVVLRTFSKSFSLAGARVGLAFACEELINGMLKVKDSYNVNRLSVAAARAALEDLPWMERNVRRIQKSRKALTAGLEQLGYQVYPSHANFVLARKAGHDLASVYERLKAGKILVRYFNAPRLKECLRITVGTAEEIKILLRRLETLELKPLEGELRAEERAQS